MPLFSPAPCRHSSLGILLVSSAYLPGKLGAGCWLKAAGCSLLLLQECQVPKKNTHKSSSQDTPPDQQGPVETTPKKTPSQVKENACQLDANDGGCWSLSVLRRLSPNPACFWSPTHLPCPTSPRVHVGLRLLNILSFFLLNKSIRTWYCLLHICSRFLHRRPLHKYM